MHANLIFMSAENEVHYVRRSTKEPESVLAECFELRMPSSLRSPPKAQPDIGDLGDKVDLHVKVMQLNRWLRDYTLDITV
jgi:hypothetical protein